MISNKCAFLAVSLVVVIFALSQVQLSHAQDRDDLQQTADDSSTKKVPFHKNLLKFFKKKTSNNKAESAKQTNTKNDQADEQPRECPFKCKHCKDGVCENGVCKHCKKFNG